jgi:hypothetical protein
MKNKVIPSAVEGARDETIRVMQRDSSTSLRYARNDKRE